MSTKIYLHGGDARLLSDKNDIFFKKLLNDVPENGVVLLVNFASEASKKEKHEREDFLQFEKARNKRKINFINATKNNFINQIDKANLIYFSGGQTSRLLEMLSVYPSLDKHLLGKVVAGESAGAKVLCSKAHSTSGGGTVKGFGLVPYEIICHYEEDENNKSKDLTLANKKVLKLKPQEFFVVDL